MNLGAFSISLSVKDLTVSRAFYETLGFTTFGGTAEHGYLIMKNGDHLVGIFQGMFEDNLLTFNPRWAQDASEVSGDDVRGIYEKVKEAGLETSQEAGLEAESGPGSFVVIDPDGNPVLIDQHV
jgi:catechol 2,3-dioxygenase-like lactoylglutathione lyase family enzyme